MEPARKGLLVAEGLLVSSRLVREEQGAWQRWSTRLREENSQWRSHSFPGTTAGTCSSVKKLTSAWKPTGQQEVGKGIVYNQVCYLILLQAWASHLCASAPSFSPSHLFFLSFRDTVWSQTHCIADDDLGFLISFSCPHPHPSTF